MKILKPKEIKKYRETQLEQQHGIDPITKEIITNPTLDHDHTSGYIRMVLDRNTNQFEGRVLNYYNRLLRYKNLSVSLPDILRNLASYLELDFSDNPYHPGYVRHMITKFKSLKKNDQDSILIEAGIKPERNLKLRIKQIKKLIQNEAKTI